MISISSKSALLLFVAIFGLVASDKDNNYYPGFSNPNENEKMYWKDAVNVLQDLDEFESLHIKYHRCVWSPYGDGSDDSPCANGDVDEEQMWYVGKTPCFRANVAYSLYGVLKGESGNYRRGDHCRKKNFINSFFSTAGVDGFADVLGIDTTYANSYCTVAGNDRDLEEDEDEQVYYQHNTNLFQNYKSTGTGCSRHGKFVLNRYKGATCHDSNFIETYDTLDSFNNELEETGCLQIYSYSEDNDDGDRRLEDSGDEEKDEEGEEENDEDHSGDNDEEDGGGGDDISYEILAYSRSCSMQEYPNGCPDPYGKKRKYEKSYMKASASNADKNSRAKKFFTWLFFLVGFFLILLAVVMNRRARRKERQRNNVKNSSGANSAASTKRSKSGKFFKKMFKKKSRDQSEGG